MDVKSDWKTCKLGDLLTFQRGHDLPKTSMVNGEYPVVGSNGIIGYHNEYTTEAPSISIGRSGNVGKPYIYYGKTWSHNTTLYIKEFKNSDPTFIYYFLKTLDLANYAGGSAVPTLNRNHIHTLNVCVPKRKRDQEKIGKYLKLIDDKIQVNSRINDNLEQQALLFFRRYFIDIQTIPKTWSKVSLLDIAEYLNGLPMQKYRPNDNEVGLPVLKIRELRQGTCDASSGLCSPLIGSDYIIHDGDVIFSWSGSLLVDLWCGGICGLNQHLFKVTSKTYDKWFYYLWTVHHLARFATIAADKATTMGHIKREELSKAEVLIPSSVEYTKIDSIMKPIINLIISNRIENRTLAALRDTLLPRLMSGEIDVSDLDL